ncbi:hypothetical protein BN7_6342 [Wickerhamomyces ciferrii]|uniref:histidine kinase n=1 Tax=Wickerhamomyces ciferrii (strain ATCC 14091 / BCRC 22168 / CBS 111 / JCM 3599 / NBRC 0793 / NRRL Y-1031 F-60-10) TaxID=1206466 RepID=K0KZI1_WICCF|nr:uncharacterized protein BN7_6342 [Wickerhamomyces ciferrii]CCH46744.1 hypothetical protein BN7_6342 [Wickerhamomyces ciferrii]
MIEHNNSQNSSMDEPMNSLHRPSPKLISPNASGENRSELIFNDLLSPVTHLSTDSSNTSEGTPSDQNFYDYLLGSATKKNSHITKDLFEVFNFSNQNSVLADASREVIPDYTLLSNISSDLYRGFNKKTKRSVLVKYTSYVSAGSISRFFNEWYSLSGLNVSNDQQTTNPKEKIPKTLPNDIEGILYPYDFITLKDNEGYVMVYEDILNLKSLKEIFVVNGDNDQNRILNTILKTLEVLKKIHQSGFTHNGLTASNILVNDMGEVYITGWDFCFPYATEDCTRGYRTLNKRYLIDWLPYMAPEVSGEINRLADYRADFYSIGIILYQLLIGFLPFIASDGRELINKHIRDFPEAPEVAGVDKFLSDVIMILLSKNASDRYQSCDYLADDLQYVLTGKEFDQELMKQRHLPFKLPRGLYGRDSSLEKIKQYYNNMENGIRLLLMTGDTGTGKTKLVNEVQTFVASNNHYFVHWKCSPRINGFGCYLSILKSVIHQVLASADADIVRCREAILDVVASSLSPLFEFIPELNDLLGPNYAKHITNINAGGKDLLPQKPELRFKYLIKSLFAALGKSFPITLFFDDFQWFAVSDLDMLREVNSLITKDNLDSRLVILATFDTSLGINLKKFKRNIDFEVDEIQMPNLPLEPFIRYTKDFMVPKQLNLQEESDRNSKSVNIQVECVAEFLYDKSQGNALTTLLMIQQLRLDDGINYDPTSNTLPTWNVDFEKLKRVPYTNTELYRSRLDKYFDKDDLELLKYISCIFDKTSFSLHDLSVVSETKLTTVAKFISKAIEYNLIYPINIFYKFPFHLESDTLPFNIEEGDIKDLSKLALFSPVHDSFHTFLQLEILTEDEAIQYHKNCGLRLFYSRDNDFIERDMNGCLEIANHFSKSSSAAMTKEESNIYIGVLKAAQTFCYKLFDFIPALKFLNVSKNLLENTSDKKALYTLHVEIVKCSVMVKNYEGCLDFIQRHSQSFQQDPTIVLYTMRCLETLGRIHECVEVGIDCLKRKNIDIEIDSDWNIKNIEVLKSSFPTSIAAIKTLADLPKAKSRKVTLIQEIMAEVIMAIVPTGKIDLISSLGYTMVAHAVENGRSGFIALAFLAIALSEIKFSRSRAQEYANLGIKLLNEKAESFDFANQVYYVYCFTIGTFLEPIEKLLRFHDMTIMSYRHYSSRFATGFVMTVAIKPIMKLFNGENVQTVYNHLMRSVNRSEMENSTNLYWFKHSARFFRALLNLPYDDRYDLQKDPDFKLEDQTLHFKCFYQALELHIELINEKSERRVKATDELFDKFQKDYPVTIFSILTMSTRAFLSIDDPHVSDEIKREIITDYLNFLQFCRSNSPKLFESKLHLFEAELLKLDGGSDLEVLDAYSDAIEKAESIGLAYDLGNIHERCGSWLYGVSPNKKRASKHLKESAKCFQISGHLKKIYLLKKQYPDVFDKVDFEELGGRERKKSEGNIQSLNLLLSTVLQKDSDQIDEIFDTDVESSNIVGVIKASLAISESIKFDSIIENLIKHTIQISSAEYAVMALTNEMGELEYKAVGSPQYVNVLQSQDSNLLFPDGLIREVIRNGRALSNFDNYYNFEKIYRSDSYFFQHQPKSMLCVPIKNEIETLGALYFESQKDSNVFTEKKLSLLSLLCTQAAFALDKARLYSRTMMAKKAAEDATAEKATFLANMSHEIRTPFNSLFACAGFLLDTKLDAIQHEYVETIQSSAKVTLNIIDAILTFSKIEHGSLYLENSSFSLNECIESAMHLIAEQAVNKNLELAFFNETQEADVVKGDLTRFRQIIINLLGNSVKFTQNGSIIVKSTAKKISQDNIYEFTISIKDTGIGIPKNSYNKVFGAFSQVDGSSRRVYGGSGLGLAISKKLVELMGGNLTFESNEGKGTTFFLTITSEVLDKKQAEKIELNGKAVVFDDSNYGRESLKLELEHLTNLDVSLLGEVDSEFAQKNDVVFININYHDKVKDKSMFNTSDDHHVVLLSPYGVLVPEDLHERELPILLLPFQRAKLKSILNNFKIPKVINSPEKPKLNTLSSSEKVLLSQEIPLEILLVEDNMINTKVALQHLKRLGYKADSAIHGVDALEKCSNKIDSTSKNYDLILMDIQMPLKDGIETSKDLESLYGGTKFLPKIVALTANVEMEDRDRCISCGMSDFISKPILPEKLAKVLRTAAGQ